MDESDEDWFIDYINKLQEKENQNIDNFVETLKSIKDQLNDISNNLNDQMEIIDNECCILNEQYNTEINEIKLRKKK